MNVQFTLNDIKSAADQLWQHGRKYSVWAFHGEMGCGKTTLIHAVCEILKVKDVITSPTFAIINEYSSPAAGAIYHMDWYRLKNEEEAIRSGIEDALLSGNFCLIEWPDRAPGLLPDDVLNIYIQVVDKITRRLNIVSTSVETKRDPK